MKKSIVLFLFLLGLFLPFSAETEEGSDFLLKRSQRIAQSYMKELKAKLVEAMSKGGPTTALDVCGVEAMRLSAAYEKKYPDVIEVKRFSDRYRNIANKPSSQETEILKLFQAEMSDGKLVSRHVVRKEGELFNFYKPIEVQGQCLLCHGPRNELAPDVRAALDLRYPDDKATGYKVGDLRGAIKIRIKPSL
jgi:hypothetical protein